MPTRFLASGRASSPAGSSGSGSGSVFALRIFCAIASSLSVSRIRLISDGSDLDILAVPSRRLITRAAVPPPMYGSGTTNSSTSKSLLNLHRDVAGQLDMLLLVLADRHVGGAVEQDVGRLQHRIGEQPDRRALAVLAGLVLELGHPVEPAHPRGALQHPGELRVGRDGALPEQHRFRRVDAAGDQRRGHLADVGAQLLGIDVDGQRVEVGEEEQALRLVLHPHPAQDRAEQIAEVEVAGRLDSGNDPHALVLRRRSVASASRSTPPIRKATPK